MQELGADAVVEADAARHLLHVAADLLAQVGDLVDEGDLHRQEGVGRVFGQLGIFQRGDEDRRLAQVERTVETAQRGFRPLVLGADNHPVGTHEVLDGRAFAQEFRVGGDGEVDARPLFADDLGDLAAGADDHGGLDHDHRARPHRLGDLARGGIDIGEIRFAVTAARGRADRDEDHVGPGDSRIEIGGEGQAPGGQVPLDQPVETGLVDGHLAGIEPLDLAGVDVDAGDVEAELGKADTRNQADIAGANHCDAHACSWTFLEREGPCGRAGGGAAGPYRCCSRHDLAGGTPTGVPGPGAPSDRVRGARAPASRRAGPLRSCSLATRLSTR